MADERWEVLGRQPALEHPFLRVTMERLRLPDGRIIPDWPIVDARDFANVVVTDAAGDLLILEGYKHGPARGCWQTVGGYLEPGEAPLAAIQRELREEAGLASDRWQALGSFVVDANRRVGTGHFYLARAAVPVAVAASGDLEGFTLRWVTPAAARQALSDGRVAVVSHAANLALALLALSS